MIPDFKSFSIPSTSSLSKAYFYTEEEIEYLRSGSAVNFPFGDSSKDEIEFYVYSLDNALITSSCVSNVSAVFTPYTRSYVDVTNQLAVYSYLEYTSGYLITGAPTQSIAINIQENLKNLSITEGTYKVGILPVRNVVGSSMDPTQRLVIDDISPSRKEFTAIPHGSRKANSSKEQNLNDEFELFAYSKIKPELILYDLLPLLERAELYKAYFSAASKNPGVDSSIKFNYSFKTDVSLINFITDMYYGVRKGSIKSGGTVSTRNVYGVFDQFRNFLYENYTTITSFSEISNYYYNLFAYILNQELNQITNSRPNDYDDIVDFFKQIFYDFIYAPVIAEVESQYKLYFSGYLKNSVNFGKGILLPILNIGVIKSVEPLLHDRLIIKLKDSLPQGVEIGDNFWISNTTVCTPVLQRIHFFSVTPAAVTRLKGPNFNVKIENEGNSTVAHSLETIIGESGSLYDELYSKLRYKIDDRSLVTVDYRYFENFIKFSSASDRLDIFKSKLEEIETVRGHIEDLDIKLALNPNEKYYQKEKDNLDKRWNEIEKSMDGYENFLYNNPGWLAEHTAVYGGLSSGSRYDRENHDSLGNNIPSAIVDDSENYEYIRFVNLIGHYFDNLTLYITQFTEKNDASNSDVEGISKDVVYNMLSSLGWEPEIGRENLPLILASFSKEDFDVDSILYNKVGTMSEDDRNKFIWKRILNTLPHILKTKGTEAAINSLINCYGIPKNIIQIKEYGGIEYTTALDQNSLYIVDETKYSPYFSGSGEYFNLPWTGSVQSLEFNFSFDENKINSNGEVFRLAVADTSWAIGVVREGGNDWGKVFFTIQDTGSNVLTSMSERAPLFSGDVYSVILRKSPISPSFNLDPSLTDAELDSYPFAYELLIRRNEDARTTFETSASLFLSGSYNTSFKLPSRVYFGNYQQNTSSLNIDPEAFFGTIDEINMWETYVSTAKFNHHASYKGSYDLENPKLMVEKGYVRVSFVTPINLNSNNGNLTIYNSVFRDIGATITASNFPQSNVRTIDSVECDTYLYTPTFPFQFKKFETRQTMSLPNFSANKFRSNKIGYKVQTLTSNLSSNSRSTINAINDSTVDTNKLGIFFSPTEQINLEIIKFFGNFEFGDLIGRPADAYERSYGRFEKFKEIFYNQGFGQLDYQSFMNLVRAYFDKSLFKYIRNLVPARTKLVDGLLVEPSILERSKVQQKQLFQETIPVRESGLLLFSDSNDNRLIPQLDESIQKVTNGRSIYEDIESTFYPDRLEPYGFEIMAQNGIAYYRDDYWRVEVVPVRKFYTVRNRVRPTSSMSNYDAYYTERGEFQTVKRTYEQVNVSKFPLVNTLPNITLVPSSSFTLVSGTIVDSNGNSIPFGSQVTDAVYIISGIFKTSLSNNTLISSSGATGRITSPSKFFRMSATIPSETELSIDSSEGLYVILLDGTIECEISTIDEERSIFDDFVGTTSGDFFSNYVKNNYSYRYDLAIRNIPAGATPLNGYFKSHKKYKKSFTDRSVIKTLDKNGNTTGTFKRGLQTSRTTVQSGTGLFDNSLPVVVSTV